MTMFRTLLISLAASATFLAASPQPNPFRQPLVFEPNRGQAPGEAKWIAHGPGYDLLFTSEGLRMFLAKKSAAASPGALPIRKYTAMGFKLEGGHPWNAMRGSEPTGGVSNYLRRQNANSLTGIPQYARLRVTDVYPGIDVVFYDNQGNLEYDFEIHPGADPKQIRITFEGNRSVRIDHSSGDLVVTTQDGSELRQHSPKIFQPAGDHHVPVSGGYQLLAQGRAAFTLTHYDRQRTLVIDPTVEFVQLLGGQSAGNAVSVDQAGNVYIAGQAVQFTTTNGTHYTDGTYDSVGHAFWTDFIPKFVASTLTFGVSLIWTGVPGFSAIVYEPDVVVAKMNQYGQILFATYSEIGVANGIAVDSTGVVITGWRTDDQHYDIKLGTGLFVQKLSPTGSFLYTSILPGADSDMGLAVALDSQHNAWVAGKTSSLRGQLQPNSRALALRVSPQGGTTDLETFGGNGSNVAYGVAVDADDNPWLTGQTCSSDFPATPGFNYMKGGKCGAFVLKLIHQPGAATVKFATTFGGSDSDGGTAIAVNLNREAYVTGTTRSLVFYTSPGAYQAYPTGSFAQGFVTHIDGFGNFLHSTLLGSAGDTGFSSIALNAADEPYVGGWTTASTFPQNGPVTPNPTAGIVAKLTPDLSALLFARQEGSGVSGVALFETLPAVTPAQIYSTGVVLSGSTSDATGMFVDKLVDDQQFNHLRNYWIRDRVINIETGSPTASQIGTDWWSADWYFDIPPNGNRVTPQSFYIRNRWISNQYLTFDATTGKVTTTTAPWLNAQWTFEQIGNNVYRLRNALNSTWCLNIESGTLSASPVQPDWWSSWWIIERGD